MSDPLLAAEQKRREAELMRSFGQSEAFQVYASLLDQVATAHVNQLIKPVPEDWRSHYMRGLIAGLEQAKTLPYRIVSLYDEELKQAEAPQEDDNRPGIRLEPEPRE